MSAALKILFAIGMLVFVVILSGSVLVLLWGWFVVPLGVKALTFPHAWGLSIVANTFLFDTRNEILKYLDPDMDKMPGWAVRMLQLLGILLFGWLVSLFM